jgi:capsular exopolysaccharide synthesis family protein
MPNDRGMSLLLHGRASVEDTIQKSPLPNLDVITRGPIIAGASEFLCKPMFDELVKRWRGEYDRIIIDTPPMLGLSEGTALQRVVDGVLLVVRSESTPKKDIRDAVTMLNKSGAHIFGFVMNRVDLHKLGNYYTYYYYSPRYYDSLETPMDHGVEAYPRGYAKA